MILSKRVQPGLLDVVIAHHHAEVDRVQAADQRADVFRLLAAVQRVAGRREHRGLHVRQRDLGLAGIDHDGIGDAAAARDHLDRAVTDHRPQRFFQRRGRNVPARAHRHRADAQRFGGERVRGHTGARERGAEQGESGNVLHRMLLLDGRGCPGRDGWRCSRSLPSIVAEIVPRARLPSTGVRAPPAQSYQGVRPSSLKNPPVGPSLPSSAYFTMTAAPWATGLVPLY